MNSVSHHWPSGYMIGERGAEIPADIVQAFRTLPVAAVGDVMGRSIGTLGLSPFHGNDILCGPAVTVRVRPGDNLMIHKAMMDAREGDVIVIDGGGDLTQAVIGGLIRTTAVAKNLGGFVLDGALRDVAEWAEGGMPAYARGVTHRGPSKEGPGAINVAVSVAGLAVNPGDLVLGDLDGVIAVPPAEVEAVLARAKAHLVRESEIRAANAAGTSDPERFNSILRAKGLPV